MMNVKQYLVFSTFVFGVWGLSQPGCASSDRVRTVSVPETTYVEIQRRVPAQITPRFKKLPPEVTLPKSPAAIAVLPFSSTQRDTAFSRWLAEDVEYGLLSFPLASERYIVFDRMRLEELFRERSLPLTSSEALRDARRLLGVEYLLTGHIFETQGSRIGFLLKAIDTRDSRILFSRKISASLDEAGRKAAQLFHEREVFDRNDTLWVERTVREPRVRYVTKALPPVENSDSLGLLLFIGFGLLLIAGVRFVS
jgi:TolB-like protein